MTREALSARICDIFATELELFRISGRGGLVYTKYNVLGNAFNI